MGNEGVIKVGIAGLGRSGWNIHARLLDPVKDQFQVVAVLDANPERLKEAEARFGCRTYGRYADLLKDSEVELVIVAMPSNLHAKFSIQALKAGKHVVCEKPMATSVADADRMIAAARKARRVLAIFQNRRYAKDFQQVLRVIQSGKLGRIVQIRMAAHGFSRRWDWQTLKKYGGGTLSNTGPHFLDQALVLFGRKLPKVFCIREKVLTLGDAEDHVKVILHGRGSPTVEVEITSASAWRQDAWLVMGSRGGLTGTGDELKWKYIDPAKLPPRVLSEQPTPDRSYNSEKFEWIEESWSAKDDAGLDEKGFYPDVFGAIRNRKPLTVKPDEVRRQLWVIAQCNKLAPV